MKDDQELKFTIYRLCRDEESKKRILLECEKYRFQNNVCIIGTNYFKILNNIISECVDDFALVCQKDVILPFDINDKIKECIRKSDLEFGRDSWGIIGNAGIEFLSLKMIRFLRDPYIIPNMSIKPIPVVFIDGNSLLLNIKNLKDNNVFLPEHLSCFSFYPFILLVESYKKNLVCAVDSCLYVFPRISVNQHNFNEVTKLSDFSDYWINQFINHNITTSTGSINIVNCLDCLRNDTDDKRYDFYEIVYRVLERIYNQKERKKIYVITRTQLNRINLLRRLLDTLRIANQSVNNIELLFIIGINNLTKNDNLSYINSLKKEYCEISPWFIIIEDSNNDYPRVACLREILSKIEEDENAFVWIIDDDDFIFPEDLKYLSIILNKYFILVGNSVVFKEEWGESTNDSLPLSSKKILTYDTRNYFNVVSGENVVPICSAIYPMWVLKKIFKTFKMQGDYCEDYAIFLLSQKYLSVQHFPILISGISFHGDNTVFERDKTHWDYSYVTFLSEVVNNNVVKSWMYDAIQERNHAIQERNHTIQEKDHAIQEKDHVIQEKDHIIQELWESIRNRENQIQAITSTLRWQICERLMFSLPGRFVWSMYMKLRKK